MKNSSLNRNNQHETFPLPNRNFETSTTGNEENVVRLIPITNGANNLAAVTVRNAVKRYGKTGPIVLNNLNMTVPKATIYSLLGSSGCGKTSLLSCLVGVRHLCSGKISVFGNSKPPPAKLIGYMPQDTALLNDFKINEALFYFGTIYGLKLSEIQSRQDFLIRFLDLPDSNRRIGTLSGGQKRRTSLSISLIHNPRLLILDEPTVGVDPLLRERSVLIM